MNAQQKKIVVFVGFVLIITVACIWAYFVILKPIKEKRKASGTEEKYKLKLKKRTTYDPYFLDTAIIYKK